jgi:hypothetical protein
MERKCKCVEKSKGSSILHFCEICSPIGEKLRACAERGHGELEDEDDGDVWCKSCGLVMNPVTAPDGKFTARDGKVYQIIYSLEGERTALTVRRIKGEELTEKSSELRFDA